MMSTLASFGDVRNAGAYPFPIQFEIAEGVDIKGLCYADDKSSCLGPIKRAAQKLEWMGCRTIAAECGYFAYFQKEIASYLDVPVFTNSLKARATDKANIRSTQYAHYDTSV